MSRRTEEWRDIPGYDGWYQISDWGRVRSFYQWGGKQDKKSPVRASTPRVMTPAINNCTLVVSLKRGEANRREPVSKLMAVTWLGGIPPGMKACHRDGDTTNNSKWNIVLLSKGDQLRATGGIFMHNRKPVLKINETLEVVGVYSSASEAARKNHFGKATIIQRCNLHYKSSVFATDGFIYAWDDDGYLRRVLRMARKELNAKGIRYNDPFTERYYDLPPEVELQIAPDCIWESAPPLVAALQESDPAVAENIKTEE